MKYWLASSNRENSKIADKNLVWGIPKRNKNLYERIDPDDKFLMYVRMEHDGDTILPSAITGAYQIEKKFEDNKVIFSVPPHMGEEQFPYRFKLKRLLIFQPPIEDVAQMSTDAIFL